MRLKLIVFAVKYSSWSMKHHVFRAMEHWWFAGCTLSTGIPEGGSQVLHWSLLLGWKGGGRGRAFSVSACLYGSLNNTNVNSGEMILGKSLILLWHFKMKSSVFRKFLSALFGTDKIIAKSSLRLSLASRCSILLVLAFAYIVTIDQGKYL